MNKLSPTPGQRALAQIIVDNNAKRGASITHVDAST